MKHKRRLRLPAHISSGTAGVGYFAGNRGRAFSCRTLIVLLATMHFVFAAIATAQVPPPQKKADNLGKKEAQSRVAGGQPLRMPDFVGRTLEDAIIEIKKHDRPAPITDPGPSFLPAGKIDHQDPLAGTIWLPDTKITLYVSNGTPPVPSATPTADISVANTLVTTGPYTAGESILYTIVVSNAGLSTATSVKIDDIPTNITFGNISGACSVLPCTIKSIDANSSATINVQATITANGAFDNVVTVTAAESDRNKANNTDKFVGTANASADVSATERLDTEGPFRAGQLVQYTMIVRNAGPSTATNISIIEKPQNLRITGMSVATAGMSVACNEVPCRIATLAKGEVATITVTASIDGEGSFENGADVTGAEQDPNPGNNNIPNMGGIAAPTPGSPPPPPPPLWWWPVLILVVGGLTGAGGAIYIIRRWVLPPTPVSPTPTPAFPTPPPAFPTPPVPVVNASVTLEPGRSSVDGLRIDGPQMHLRTSLEMGEVTFDGPVPIVKKEIIINE